MKTSFTFTPAVSGEYYIEVQDADDFNLTTNWGTDGPGPNVLAGKEYSGYIQLYDVYGRHETANIRMTLDQTQITVSGITMDKAQYLAGEKVSAGINVTVQGGTVKEAELEFYGAYNDVTEEYDQLTLRLDEVQENVLLVSGSTPYTGTYELKNILIYDYLGKCFWFNVEALGLQKSVTVTSVSEAVGNARPVPSSISMKCRLITRV